MRACARQRRWVKAGEGSWVTMLLVLVGLGNRDQAVQVGAGLGRGVEALCYML